MPYGQDATHAEVDAVREQYSESLVIVRHIAAAWLNAKQTMQEFSAGNIPLPRSPDDIRDLAARLDPNMDVDPKTLDAPTLRFMLAYLQSERGCYTDKYAAFDAATGAWTPNTEANEAWRQTVDGLIEWITTTITVVEKAKA
jgi:hypothetical protein